MPFWKTAAPRCAALVEADAADAEAVDKADDFEAKFNFRFEQAGGAEIETHARGVEGSLRRPDTKRREERERKKARKAEERARHEAETRRLMNAKRTELRGRVARIADVTGDSIDAEKLAAAFGYGYWRVDGHENLGALREAIEAPGATICEVMIDENASFAPKLGAKVHPDGRMTSPPLEDLSPFLPREVLRENMRIPLLEE